jgi:hypothetical protein
MSKKHRVQGVAPQAQGKQDRIKTIEATLQKLIPDFLGFRGKSIQNFSDIDLRTKEFRSELTDHSVSLEAFVCLLSDLTGIHRGILVNRYFEYKGDGFPQKMGVSKGQLIVQKFNFGEVRHESFIIQE